MLPEKNFTLHSLVKLYEILLDGKTETRKNTPPDNKKTPLKAGPLKTSLDKLEFTLEFIPKI